MLGLVQKVSIGERPTKVVLDVCNVGERNPLFPYLSPKFPPGNLPPFDVAATADKIFGPLGAGSPISLNTTTFLVLTTSTFYIQVL